MKIINKALSRGVKRGKSAMMAVMLAAPLLSQAQTYNFGTRNTSLQLDVTSGPGVGLSDWAINGVSQLQSQWFYYSVGSGVVNSIDTVGPASAASFGGSVIAGVIINTNISTSFTSSSLNVGSTFSLQSQSAGSPKASLSTTLTLQNTSGTNEVLHLYQFSDFDLNGVTGGQNVQFAGTTSPFLVTQTGVGAGPLTGSFSALAGGNPTTVEEIAGIVDGTQFGLINGNVAPLFANTQLSAGAGDVEYAYEIDATLLNGQTLTVSELQTVPEPSSLALISSGILALTLFSWRRTAFRPLSKKN